LFRFGSEMTDRPLAWVIGGEVVGPQALAPGQRHSAKDRSLSVRLSAIAPGGFLAFSHSGDDFATCRDSVRKRLGFDADGWKGGDPKGGDQKTVSRPIVSVKVDNGHAAAALRIWAETLLADGDDAGTRAAQEAARRWKNEGRRVRIARPPRGTEFNDIARRAASAKEVA
jgi:hypothetical protein